MLTKHKVLCAKFLESHFDEVSATRMRRHQFAGSMQMKHTSTVAHSPSVRLPPSLVSSSSQFCAQYNVLLQSRNYVTKRQSLKLLGELLLNRSNFTIMMKYINSPDNLKIMMNLLRGATKAIQFEAFHVFKIFVANPKKSPGIVEILSRNKRKLIEFLTKFQKDKDNVDEQFNDEKNTLLATLNQLEDLSEPTAPATSSATGSESAPAAAAAAQ